MTEMDSHLHTVTPSGSLALTNQRSALVIDSEAGGSEEDEKEGADEELTRETKIMIILRSETD